MSGKLSGKVAIVTGGARGQGRKSHVRAMVREGPGSRFTDVRVDLARRWRRSSGAAADVHSAPIFQAAGLGPGGRCHPSRVRTSITSCAHCGTRLPEGKLHGDDVEEFERVIAVNQTSCFWDESGAGIDGRGTPRGVPALNHQHLFGCGPQGNTAFCGRWQRRR